MSQRRFSHRWTTSRPHAISVLAFWLIPKHINFSLVIYRFTHASVSPWSRTSTLWSGSDLGLLDIARRDPYGHPTQAASTLRQYRPHAVMQAWGNKIAYRTATSEMSHAVMQMEMHLYVTRRWPGGNCTGLFAKSRRSPNKHNWFLRHSASKMNIWSMRRWIPVACG